MSITRTGSGTTTFPSTWLETSAYSGDGARVKKVGPTKTIRYIGGFEDQVTDGAQVKHIVVGSLRIATRVVGGPNAGTYFTHGDHLGSLNVLTNSQGVEVQRLTYLPFGETHSNQGSVDFHQRRYTGQEQDPETGLYFYNARYYNPALGRFISPDPIVPEPGNPQNLNRYSYVNNNPVNLVDPSGHFSLGGFFKSLFSVAAGILVGIATGGMGAPAVVAGMLGAAAGAVNTALTGGNLGTNVLVGAAFGGFAAGVGGPLAQSLGGGLQGAVGSGAILGAAYGGIGAAAAGKNVLTGMLAGAVSGALLAAAIYGGSKAWDAINSPTLEGNPRINEAINKLETTEWSKTDSGRAIVHTLNNMNSEGRIIYGEYDPDALSYYNRDRRTLTVSSDIDEVHLPGRLAHEGSHAVWHQKGLPYNFANERAAYNAGYTVDAELKVPDAFNPPDWWIRMRYGLRD